MRAAIVGAGLMGRWHADAVARIGGQVSVVVDPDIRRARELAHRHSGARAATNLADIVGGGAADVVHVCTPLDTHEPLARTALTARTHVLAEKPLAPTTAVTAELLRLAGTQGVLLCPVHQFLFQCGVLRAQQQIPDIGAVLHLDFVACSAGALDGSAIERDRIAANILPHPLSLIERLLPGSLAEIEWRVQRPRAGELSAVGASGATTLSLLVSMGGRPTVNMLRLIGERGTIHLDLFHGFHVREHGHTSRADKIAHPFRFASRMLAAATANLARRAVRRESAYPGLRELIRRFHAAAHRGEPAPIGDHEIMEVAAARDRLLTRLA